MKIKYVGVKEDGETAFSRETGITWLPGMTEEVNPAIATKMLQHPDVFAEASDIKPGVAEADKPAVVTGDTTPLAALPSDEELQAMSKPDLHGLAKARNVKVHHSAGAATVIAALKA